MRTLTVNGQKWRFMFALPSAEWAAFSSALRVFILATLPPARFEFQGHNIFPA